MFFNGFKNCAAARNVIVKRKPGKRKRYARKKARYTKEQRRKHFQFLPCTFLHNALFNKKNRRQPPLLGGNFGNRLTCIFSLVAAFACGIFYTLRTRRKGIKSLWLCVIASRLSCYFRTGTDSISSILYTFIAYLSSFFWLFRHFFGLFHKIFLIFHEIYDIILHVKQQIKGGFSRCRLPFVSK